ncbi:MULTISPECIES: hypothetical protein [unclassified Streptomyces]|uniref:hypothetical protein n=1 Tax=unclassified Streptomyces TaxID=2593676 RepID=UPI0007461D73|nr:hypothetical protein ADL34_33350 [Streptomyces sp. NRRL WC-3605]KUL73997.1 hypothetical protein ADL33_18560 [Streptomyces sp. NRRL WC-3604]
MPVLGGVWHDAAVSGSLYETHVTVRCADAAEAGRLRRWSAAAGLKLTCIELARGRVPSQPMLTLTGAPSRAAAAAGAEEMAARLRAGGFSPVRVKIESAPWAPEVPVGPCGGGQYFEHHVRLRLPADTDLGALAARVVPHGAHLSWNARRVVGALHERFATQRCHGADAAGAGRALEALLSELAGFDVVDVEREFVLYDSDLSVDDGWIEERPGRTGDVMTRETRR